MLRENLQNALKEAMENHDTATAVSYTHLTLPTTRLV